MFVTKENKITKDLGRYKSDANKKKTYTKQEILRFEYHKKNKSHQLSFYYQNDELCYMDQKNFEPESCGV